MPRLPYPKIAPELYERLVAVGHQINTGTALGPVLIGIVYLRASILNGCHYCTGLHKNELRQRHEPASRIDAVADWQASDAFTPRERAALAWTDVVTRLTGEDIPEAAFAAAHEFFTDEELVNLTFAIANINAWNRLGVAFAMEWVPRAGKAASAGVDRD